jgi:hypothetical protein
VGNGDNIIIGGIGADTITAGDGENIVFGDAGMVSFTNFNRNQVEGQTFDVVDDVILLKAQSTYPTVGAADTITVGSGNEVIFGGIGNDTITTNSIPPTPAEIDQQVPETQGSAYVIFGGTGTVSFDSGGWVSAATLTFQTFTGTDTITIGSNLPVVLSGATDELMTPLDTPVLQMASGPAPTGQDVSPNLTNAQLQPIVVEAEAIWAKLLGPDSARLAILNGITVQVGDLGGNAIGATVGDTIYLDNNADGWGWFTDWSVAGDAEFGATSTAGLLTAAAGSAASGQMDLLSTVLHEMGNILGFPEDTGQDIMDNTLASGERILPVLGGALGTDSGIPVIDWNANNAAVAAFIDPGTDAVTWVDGFLNNLGQAGKTSPNAAIRIKVPGG